MSDIIQETKPTSLVPTASGAVVDLENIGAAEIKLYDISYGLSNTNRWSGQFGNCNVAQHSALVTYLTEQMLPKDLPEDIRQNILKFALMHDAPEAYLGEVPSPVKKKCPAYMVLEEALMARICNSMGIYNDYPSHDKLCDIVKVADSMATVVERATHHRLVLSRKPKRVIMADGSYSTAFSRKVNDLLKVLIAYKGMYAECPIGKTWKTRIPTWEWYIIDLFGDFSI